MLESPIYPHSDTEQKLHDWNIIPKNERAECDEVVPSKIGRKKLNEGPKPITWTVSDIAKAGCLLHTPPIGTVFEDEQEMRRVYTLIYDVFRYKNVLMQALNDINFFQIFEQLEVSIPIVWLLFYDLYHRSFKKRETSVREIVATLFRHAKLSVAENALWCQRVRLAAAVSRLRIKYNALTLTELLPSHLRGDRVSKDAQNIPVTVWINNKKFKNSSDIRKQIEHALKVKLVDDVKDLGPCNFKWDRHCPYTVAFHYSMRTQLAKSNLVRSHKLIVQDRSFCVGPATFWKVVEDLQLSGSVIQTHVNSPRSTAYLANLLAQNEKIKKLMAFSAGIRKNEYENYLNELGMTNVVVYSDRLVDIGFESSCMEEVVAVYATPPNSYSAVTDPIDLVCSRGGDLSMLEILTESEDTFDGRSRVTKILEEQRKTLKFAMSRPQIQVVLYETHSELDVENCEMVTTTLDEINKIAKLHHATMQGFVEPDYMSSETRKEINNNEDESREQLLKVHEANLKSRDNCRKDSGCTRLLVNLPNVPPKDLENVVVPDTDLFDTPDLPCLCPEETNCKMENGCYLALIQRKQVLRLDNKYMIQMAEQRGLFGSNNDALSKQKGSKQSRKKQQNMKQEVRSKKTRRKLKDFEVLLKTVPVLELPEALEEMFRKREEKKYEERMLQDLASLKNIGNNSQKRKIDEDLTPDDSGKVGGILEKVASSQLEAFRSPKLKMCSGHVLSSKIPLRGKTKQKFVDFSPDYSVCYGDKIQIINKLIYRPTTVHSTEAVRRTATKKCAQSMDEDVGEFSSTSNSQFENESGTTPNLLTQGTQMSSTFNSRSIARQRKYTMKSLMNRPLWYIKRKLLKGTFNVQAGPSVNVYKCSLKLKNKGKFTAEMIERLSTPTESSRVRCMKEECLPPCRRTDGGTATRAGFLCESCKKRHTN